MTDPRQVDRSSVPHVGRQIDAALAIPGLPALVAAYFDPNGPFAGSTFDTLGRDSHVRDPDRLTVEDLLAVSLLDVSIRPLAMRQILGDDAAHIEGLIRAIPPDTDLWAASPGDLAHAEKAWRHLRTYQGIAWVTAGKLLARKRPRLVPIVDSVILEVLGPPRGETWTTLAAALGDKDRRDRIDALAPPDEEVAPSTLRLIDVALWMLGSQSTNARRARATAGVADGAYATNHAP